MKNRFIYTLLFLCTFTLSSLIIWSCNKENSTEPQISQTGLTDEEKRAIIKTDSLISLTADSILLTGNPSSGWQQMLNSYRNYSNIEDANVVGNNLYIKYKNGGYRAWYTPTVFVMPPYPDKVKFEKGVDLKNTDELVGNTNALFINNTSLDDRFNECENLIDALSDNFSSTGYTPLVKNNTADVNFFKNELKNYGVIYLLSHGSHDAANLPTWVQTSQNWNWIDFLWNSTFNEDWRNGSILPGYATEVHNGNTVTIKYLYVSDRFISAKYNQNDFPHSLIFLCNCQTFKFNDQLAQAFINKGVGVVIGYTESVCRSPWTGQHILDAMLGGANLQFAWSSLPTEDFNSCCEPNTGAQLTCSPGLGVSGSIQLVSTSTGNLQINTPVDGQTYNNWNLNLTGSLLNAQSIQYGQVELNNVTTQLVYSGLNFLQPVVIKQGSNTIKVNCFGKLNNGNSVFASKTIHVTGNFSLDLWTELRWNTDYSDVDLHLLPPGYSMNSLWTSVDCYYNNKITSWGGVLDVDDVNGFGPEHITIDNATLYGDYYLYIHYYNAHNAGNTNATLTITTQAENKNFGPYLLRYDGGNNHGDVWEVCKINLPSGNITHLGIYHNLGNLERYVKIPEKN